MHSIGLFNLLFVILGIDASISGRWSNDMINPGIIHPEELKRYEGYVNNKGIPDQLVRIRRNKEKIPLMIGKGSSIVKNSTLKVSGFLSDLKIDCRTLDDCSSYLQSACGDRQLCNCTRLYPVFVASQKSCVKPVALNASCSFLEQCTFADIYSECEGTRKTCVCIENYFLKEFPEMGFRCVTKSHTKGRNQIDPTMISVLVALGLMFAIICVVLRLFSKARFRENRSIFNTPNPRLMNASLFKDKRRGSALSTVSATGSATGVPTSARSEGRENHLHVHKQTTVAIDAVD